MEEGRAPDKKSMYTRVDEVLHYIWDPIGVSTMSAIPRSEYHFYLPQVFRLVIEEAGEDAIADYLLSVERNEMEMNQPLHDATRPEICRKVASLLVSDWAELHKYYSS